MVRDHLQSPGSPGTSRNGPRLHAHRTDDRFRDHGSRAGRRYPVLRHDPPGSRTEQGPLRCLCCLDGRPQPGHSGSDPRCPPRLPRHRPGLLGRPCDHASRQSPSLGTGLEWDLLDRPAPRPHQQGHAAAGSGLPRHRRRRGGVRLAGRSRARRLARDPGDLPPGHATGPVRQPDGRIRRRPTIRRFASRSTRTSTLSSPRMARSRPS